MSIGPCQCDCCVHWGEHYASLRAEYDEFRAEVVARLAEGDARVRFATAWRSLRLAVREPENRSAEDAARAAGWNPKQSRVDEDDAWALELCGATERVAYLADIRRNGYTVERAENPENYVALQRLAARLP